MAYLFALAALPLVLDGSPENVAPDGVLTARLDPAMDAEAGLARQGIRPVVTSFHGYRELDFTLADGTPAKVVQPVVAAARHPLLWRGEFFGHEPQTDLALLARGYHVVYVDTHDLFGAPTAMRIWESFLDVLRRAGLDGKIALVGMSRGALYCYHWAALHPETVSVIYGDAPVCDLKSWPLCLGRSQAGRSEVPALLRAYGFRSEAEAIAYRENPIDLLPALAQARIPILHVIGEADQAAPVEENSDRVESRYRKLGGTIQVIRKPGAGHHPHSLPNPQPIVDFILAHAS